jgi:DNA invertase Pin-like site-specific DNA recombinase
MVMRLDRLARSTRDLLNIRATIAGKGAGFRSLGDTWADTTRPHGHFMLTVLGGLAEFERELIRTRTSEGRAHAVANGVKLGRKPKLTAHQKREAIKRRDEAEDSAPWASPHVRLCFGKPVTTFPENELGLAQAARASIILGRVQCCWGL